MRGLKGIMCFGGMVIFISAYQAFASVSGAVVDVGDGIAGLDANTLLSIAVSGLLAMVGVMARHICRLNDKIIVAFRENSATIAAFTATVQATTEAAISVNARNTEAMAGCLAAQRALIERERGER